MRCNLVPLSLRVSLLVVFCRLGDRDESGTRQSPMEARGDAEQDEE